MNNVYFAKEGEAGMTSTTGTSSNNEGSATKSRSMAKDIKDWWNNK